MFRELVVHVVEVGREPLGERAVLGEEILKPHVPLRHHRVGERGRVRRENLRDGAVGDEVADVQPLPSEALDEGARLGVGDHSIDLRLEHRGLEQIAALGSIEQRGVRHRAPVEVREARGQLVARQRVRLDGARGRIVLDAIEKIGRRQHRPHGEPDRFGAVLRAREVIVVHLHGASHLGRFERTAVDLHAEGLDDLPRTRISCRRGRARHEPRLLCRVRQRLGHQIGRRLEVSLVLADRHAEGGGGVVELQALLGQKHRGRLRRGPEQIADRVVVFGVVEAMDGDASGIDTSRPADYPGPIPRVCCRRRSDRSFARHRCRRYRPPRPARQPARTRAASARNTWKPCSCEQLSFVPPQWRRRGRGTPSRLTNSRASSVVSGTRSPNGSHPRNFSWHAYTVRQSAWLPAAIAWRFLIDRFIVSRCGSPSPLREGHWRLAASHCWSASWRCAQTPAATAPDSEPSFSVVVERDDLAGSCPDLPWFTARIASHAGKAGHAGHFEITLAKRGDAWQARIQRWEQSRTSPAAERVLQDRSPACGPLAEAVALTIAILADDYAKDTATASRSGLRC